VHGFLATDYSWEAEDLRCNLACTPTISPSKIDVKEVLVASLELAMLNDSLKPHSISGAVSRCLSGAERCRKLQPGLMC